MASTSSVDGLISGMSTSSVISSLMQIESQGKTLLQNKVTTENKTISTWQSLNTKVADLKTAATTLLDADTWKAVKATSSSSTVSATATVGAGTGSLTFDVDALAKANIKAGTVSTTGSIQDGTGLKIKIGSADAVSVTVATDTAQGVVDAINGAGIGVKAALVTTTDGTKLQLTSTKTGTANAITGISGLSAGITMNDVAQASDAKITIGKGSPGEYSVTSSSNTFTNVLPNLNVTVSKLESDVTVNVAADVSGIADKVRSMVAAANALNTQIAAATKVKSDGTADGTTASPLTGNFLARSIADSVLSSVSSGLNGYGSFAQLGIQLNSDGTQLSFDADKFTAAYQADATKVKDALTNGVGGSLKSVATLANTNVTSAIQSGTDKVSGLNKQIDDWTDRLKLRQESLERQFTAMETALGKLKNQSSWLSSQIASLSSSSG